MEENNVNVQQALTEKLGSRPSVVDLQNTGVIHNAGVAPSIAGAAHSVEKSLARRSSRADLGGKGILDPNMENPEAYYAEKERQRLEKQAIIQKSMNTRPSTAELERQNILYDSRVAPAMQANAMALRKEQIAKNLASSMSSRPSSANEIKYMEHSNVAASVRGVAYDLNNQLQNRPNSAEVSHFQQAYSTQAPSLQPAGYAVANALNNRPTYEDLHARGLVGVGDRKNQNAELLQQQLGRRQSKADVAGMMPHSNVAPRLQAAAYDLEASLAGRTARDNTRPDFSTQQMAHSMQPAAYALNKQLGRRMSRDDVAARGMFHERGYGLEAYQLEQRMANRPNELPSKYAPHGYMDRSIQAPAHALSEKLKARPNQADVQYFAPSANRQAPAIQGVGENLRKALNRRPSKAELEATNILTRMNQKSVKHRANELGGVFGARPDRNAVPDTIHQDHGHIGHHQESKERFRRNSAAVGDWFTQRPTENQVPNKYYVDASENKKRGSTEFRENEFESAWEQQFTTGRPTPNEVPAKYFQEPQLKDRAEAYNLANKLKRRPTLDNIVAKGLIPNSHMAPSLRGVADMLEKQIGHVPNYEDMLKAGFTPEYLAGKSSAAIQPAAKRVSNFIGNRMTIEELERRGILRNSRQQYERNSEMISPMFMQRKNRDELDQKILHGGVNQNMANSMRPAAFDLEKKLRNRRDSQDLFNQNILKVDPNSTDRLAMHKYYQDQKNIKSNLEKSLKRRMSIDDLQARGIFQGKGVHDQLAGRRKDLEKDLRRRDLQDKLASRPLNQEVPNKYFMEPRNEPRGGRQRRQSDAFRQTASTMDQLFGSRPIPNAVPHSYFQEPNRQHEARKSISGAFANRMSPQEMMRRGLLKHDHEEGFAPVDMAIFANDNKDVKSSLEQQLKSRQSVMDLQQKGYIPHGGISHGIAPAAHSLEGKLRRRMSVDDLAARNILKSSGMAPRLQAQADRLGKERLQQKLNSRMSRRPDRDELIKQGLIDKKFANPQQYEAKRQLEMNLRRHQMEDMLASKKKENELDQRYFMEGRNRRGRAMSTQMSNTVANMNGLLANRPAEYEVPNSYFVPASKKRRMSVEMENIARNLENKLVSRPGKEDIEQNMWITSTDARGHNGRRVSHSMKQNQDILAGLFIGKKDMDQISENVFREPSKKRQLQDRLQRRMSRDDLQARGILNQYHSNHQLAGRMTDLEQRLGRRSTIDQLQQQNIMRQGYGYVDHNMAEQKRLLDQQMRAQHLNQRLLNRPEKSDLADRGYLDDSGLAPRLHPAALTLNQKLVDGGRMDRDELVKRGILSGSHRRMSRSLMPAAHELEKKLKRRMSIDDLSRRNIIDNSGKSARVVDAHKSLHRERRASRVEQMLQHRPTLQNLQNKGIYTDNRVAPKLQGAAVAIGKHLKRRPSQADVAHFMEYRQHVTGGRHTEVLEDHLAARPLPSDLKRSGVLPGVAIEHQLDDYKFIDNRDDYIRHEKAKQRMEAKNRQAESEEWIEMKPTTFRRDSMTQRNDVPGMGRNRMRRMSNALQGKLAMRPAMSDLADRGLLDDSGMAPRLQPTALQVQQNLTGRVDRQELIRRGILPDQRNHVANQISGRVQDLSQHMRRRPTLTDVAGKGYVSAEYARQFETSKDRHRRISVALEGKLRYRPTKEHLADQGILDDSPLAPSLHAKAIDLQTRLIQQMSRSELQARGILTSDHSVARAIQGTRATLDQKMRRRMSRQDMTSAGYLDSTATQLSTRLAGAAREVSKGLRRRPSMDDLRSRNILSQYDQSMPPEMVQQAKQKNRDNKAERIKDMLSTRPPRESISAYQNFAVADVANSIQGAGHAVSKMLRRRPSVDVLQQRNILQGSYQMGASAGRAHELGFQQRRNTISQFMQGETSKRKQQATLESLGLPANIATEDHIKRVLDMNQQMMLQMRTMQEQLNVLQMTCQHLVNGRDQWKDQVKSLAQQNTQELEMMKDYVRESMSGVKSPPSSASNLAAPMSPGGPQKRNSFRSELRDFKEEVVGMQQQAKQYLINERKQFEGKEAAFKAHMLESDIQITRLQGEYEFTISSPQAGLKFESCDNGRNLCVKAVLKGSEPERNGVMPGDVIITIRNPKENRVRRVENQDAQVTLQLFRQHPRPMICKFRKYEAHHQLRDLWRKKRELLENVPESALHDMIGAPDSIQAHHEEPMREPGAKPQHRRRDSNLFHENDMMSHGITQDMMSKKREMEEALLQLRAAGHTDPIVRAFEEMDKNKNGDLSEEEFIKGLYRIGIGEGLNSAQMKHVFKILDEDESGYIDYQEFESFLKHGQQDPICEFVQRHIRERIAALITSNKGDRVVQAGSMSNVEASVKQQQRVMTEREMMMQAMQAQRNGSSPSSGKAREGFSEEDQYQIKQLTEEIGNILQNAESWRAATDAIRKKIPNLEVEIAKELYPLIQNGTVVERQDVIRRTLHIVDVLHAKVAPTKEEIMADKPATQDIDNLVKSARRMSTNDAAGLKQMENLRYAQARAAAEDERQQQEDDDSSEEEYYGSIAPQSPEAKADPTKASRIEDINKELAMEKSGMTNDQLMAFKQAAMGDVDNEESAFEEEYAEERTNAARQAIVDKPTIQSKRRPSRQAKQDAMLGMFGKVDTGSGPVPEMKNIDLPPTKAIKRRASEKIATAIPKRARGSIDGLEPLSVATDDATDDDDKRAPETPRKDNTETGKRIPPKNNNILESSTGGGEMGKTPTPTETET